MTHPQEARAVQTNGVGKRTTAHLNLTRTLADDGEVAIWNGGAANAAWWAAQKRPFAGKEKP